MNQNIQALLAKTRRQAMLGVSLNQSPLLAIASPRSSQMNTDLVAHCLTAFSATDDNQELGWISAKGLMAMADILFHNSQDYRQATGAYQEAMYYGALTALWVATSQDRVFNRERIIASRRILISKIKKTPPSITQVRQAGKKWLEYWESGRTAMIHTHGSQWFPVSLLEGGTQEFIARLVASCNGREFEALPIPTEEEKQALREVKAMEEIKIIWPTLQEYEILSFFMHLAAADVKYDKDMARAMFCMVATTTKSSHTPTWVSTRWRNLQIEVPQLAEEEAFDTDILQVYESVFQRPILSIGQKVNILFYGYFLAHQQGLDTIKRIIEQSRAPHVSGLSALCNLTMRYPTVTHTSLSRLFGMGQVTSIINLAATLINNPYASIITTPVPVSAYADIAYLASAVVYSDNRQGRYISPAEKHLKKTKEYLNEFARGLKAMQEQAAADDSASLAMLAAYGLRVSGESGDLLNIEPVAAPMQLDPNAAGQPISIRKRDIVNFLLSLETDKDRAFKQIMSELNNILMQAPLPMPTGNDYSVSASTMQTTAIPQGIIDCLTTLEIPISQDWTMAKPLLEVNTVTGYYVATRCQLSDTHRSAGHQHQAPPMSPPPVVPRAGTPPLPM